VLISYFQPYAVRGPGQKETQGRHEKGPSKTLNGKEANIYKLKWFWSILCDIFSIFTHFMAKTSLAPDDLIWLNTALHLVWA